MAKFPKDKDIVIKTKNLTKGRAYSRNDLRDIHNLQHPKREYWNGIARHKNKIILWVTLDKTKGEYKYNDYFKDNYFFSDAQNNNTENTEHIKQINGGDQPLLFCRIKTKSPFIYFGPLKPKEIFYNEKPIRFKYELLWLPKRLPKEVKSILKWEASTKEVTQAPKIKRKIKDPKHKGRKAEDIIPRADIYKVEFEVEGNRYVYVGQDSKCQKDYYGSSLIMFHYEAVFGAKIFNKSYLGKKLKNIKLWKLNELESKYIREEKIKAEKAGVFSINNTGKNQRITSIENTLKNRTLIIEEANLLGLNLEVKGDGKRGVLEPGKTYPHITKGMHIQINRRLNGLGFTFSKKEATDKNMGLAREVIRELNYEPQDSTDGDYSLVMAMHGLKDPAELAKEFYNLLEISYKYFK